MSWKFFIASASIILPVSPLTPFAGSLISAWLTEIIGRTDRSICARLAPITASSLMAPEFQTMQQRHTGAQTPPIIPLATVDYLPFVP